MKQISYAIQLILKIPAIEQLWKLWETITADWRIYLEQPIPLEELTLAREAASIPSFGFFLLLSCASVLAALGLLANSTAVIIGAMIVAPLMNPILSMAFGAVTGNSKLYRRSLTTVILGTLCTIIVSYLISELLPITVVGSEIVARTSPNLIDLGIAIAAGVAGAFALTRQSIASSIAGVAIAVALVPPLCVVGIGIGIGENLTVELGRRAIADHDVSVGAFLLFLANLSGIMFSACVVFLTQSYGSLKKALLRIVVWTVFVGLLSAPLADSLREFLIANRIGSEMNQLRIDKPEFWQETQILFIEVGLQDDIADVRILVNAPAGLLTDEHLKTYVEQRLLESISNMGVRAMNLAIGISPVAVREYDSTVDIRDLIEP